MSRKMEAAVIEANWAADDYCATRSLRPALLRAGVLSRTWAKIQLTAQFVRSAIRRQARK